MFFQSVSPLLAQVESITVNLRGNPDGTLSVLVMPKAKDGSALALSTPLMLTAAAADLDNEFATVLEEYADTRLSLTAQLELTKQSLKTAVANETPKPSKASASKNGASSDASDVPEVGDEETDEPAEEVSSPAPASDSAAAAPVIPNLWG